MKILMRNIGMTLHVIHKLRARGITNVQVNMDWQHLIMNGEALGEYAAMLAAEGLLGHQHANSGWGTFDDDNMVGATAFMETLELAVELRRAGYGENGERLGFDLYPYTEDAVAAVARSVKQWRFIWDVVGPDRRRRAARGAVAQGRGPRLRARLRRARRVSRRRPEDAVRSPCSGSRRGRLLRTWPSAPGEGTSGRQVTALVGLDVGTTGVKAVAISPEGEVLAGASAAIPLSTPRPGWAEQDPEDWWRAARVGASRRSRRVARSPGSASRARCTGSSSLDAADRVIRPAILWNDQPHGGRVCGDRGAGRRRAADRADREPCARPASRRRSCSGCAATSRTRTRGSRTSCCRRTTSACA